MRYSHNLRMARDMRRQLAVQYAVFLSGVVLIGLWFFDLLPAWPEPMQRLAALIW